MGPLGQLRNPHAQPALQVRIVQREVRHAQLVQLEHKARLAQVFVEYALLEHILMLLILHVRPALLEHIVQLLVRRLLQLVLHVGREPIALLLLPRLPQLARNAPLEHT